jgi:hypothetical protein
VPVRAIKTSIISILAIGLLAGSAVGVAAQASRDAYQAQLEKSGFGEITTDIIDAADFYYAEPYHQQYLSKNPDRSLLFGPSHGTGVACPTWGKPTGVKFDD